MSIIIEADPSNLKDIAFLFNRYRIFYRMPSDIDAVNKFIQKRLELTDSLIFLSYKETTATGFIQIYRSFSSVAMQPIWILNDLYVDEDYRREGHAKLLMNHIKNRAKTEGIFSIKLATSIHNKNAKSLYRTLGYQLNQGFENYSLLTK